MEGIYCPRRLFMARLPIAIRLISNQMQWRSHKKSRLWRTIEKDMCAFQLRASHNISGLLLPDIWREGWRPILWHGGNGCWRIGLFVTWWLTNSRKGKTQLMETWRHGYRLESLSAFAFPRTNSQPNVMCRNSCEQIWEKQDLVFTGDRQV